MKKSVSLQVASIVLGVVELYVAHSIASINCPTDKIYVETYSNCREQGYSIVNHHNARQVSFSQNRNTDNIVVYFGAPSDFLEHNIPSEEIYTKAKYFKYEEYSKAGSFVLDFLMGNTNG